ncbi:MAG: serine/threonine-protein kinase [Persicimonas sp.]
MVKSDPDARLRSQLAPGSRFEGKYDVLSELGTGSFAIVVKATHSVMGRDVALKCLKPSVVRSNPEVSERFVTEVQIVSRLRHPNTVTIFDFGQTADNLAYMVLEYLEGVTLDELIATQGALDEGRAIHICRQILKSLAEAHNLGIVHRDLKPSNIMLTEMHGEPDFVKVLDFGVAKLLEESEQRGAELQPRSTQFIGTPVYMSPEQVLGKSVSPASDLYSLGLILYEMLTGDTPIEHENVASVVREHLDEDPLPFGALEMVSEPMRKLILKATTRQPKRRFRSVGEFARALPVDGVVESIEMATPQGPAAEAAHTAGLGEESSEADIFSGKNYFDVPEPEEHWHSSSPAAASPRPAASGQRGKRRSAQASASTRRPSPRPESLDLDLDTVDRQRRRNEQRRPRKSRSRSVDGGWEMREYWTRLSAYFFGAAAGYWAFVLLSSMMYEQSEAVRFGGAVLIGVTAVMWTAFSSVQAVGVGFSRRWLVPSARNLIYIFCTILLAAAFWRPSDAAAGLSQNPAWFFDALPAVAPLTWLSAATEWVASLLVPIFEYLAGALPY